MLTVTELFAALGRDRIRRETGHGHQVLSRAVVENIMPSHWFFDFRRMCDADGIECPEQLFRRAKQRSTQQDVA